MEKTIEFAIDGVNVGSSVLIIENGKIDTSIAEEEFYKILRKNEKRLIELAADEEREQIVDNLTPAQEDKLKEAHAKDYIGTDDDMPDSYEGFLEDLDLDELKKILA